MFRILFSPPLNRNTLFTVGVLFKTIVLSFMVIILLSFNYKRVNDPIDDLYQQANGRLSVQGALFIRQNFVYHIDPCRRIPDDGGALWKCVYSNGLVVYNCFRRCRGSIEAGRYFLGISDGDCDAFTFVNNQRKSVCYPGQANILLSYCGQVIAIERIGPCLTR
jgi:hypothetical protein